MLSVYCTVETCSKSYRSLALSTHSETTFEGHTWKYDLFNASLVPCTQAATSVHNDTNVSKWRWNRVQHAWQSSTSQRRRSRWMDAVPWASHLSNCIERCWRSRSPAVGIRTPEVRTQVAPSSELHPRHIATSSCIDHECLMDSNRCDGCEESHHRRWKVWLAPPVAAATGEELLPQYHSRWIWIWYKNIWDFSNANNYPEWH